MFNRFSTALTIGCGVAIAATMTSPALANECDDSGLGTLPSFCTLSFEGTSGEWTGSKGGRNINTFSDGGKEFIDWGWGWNGGPKSSYSFEGVRPLEDIQVGKAFKLGTFTHNNNVIYGGTGVDSADLTVNFDFGGNISAQSFEYTFHHEETPNSGHCEYNLDGDRVKCADKVTWVNALDDGEFEFEHGGEKYQLEIAGFRRDGDTGLVDEFITTEHEANKAFLMGRIKHITPPTVAVPEPASLLGLLAVAGIGFASRRKLAEQV
ncbi:MAG: THxN family PEP-CTERM protein [Leptolyngbyaceae cyanobacterium]